MDRKLLLDELLRIKEKAMPPSVIAHCGSTRVALEAFEYWRLQDTLSGLIVLTIGANKHDQELQIPPDHALKLDLLHLFKIEMAEYVRVLNVGGYIGESTHRELVYALRLGKRVLFTEADTRLTLPGVPCSDCRRDGIEVRPCVYCGVLVCLEDSFDTDAWDLGHIGIPIGSWMCTECSCK